MTNEDETFSSEGPKCPYCGAQFIADEPHYFDEMNYRQEECDECEKTFKVSVCIDTTWTSSRVEGA